MQLTLSWKSQAAGCLFPFQALCCAGSKNIKIGILQNKSNNQWDSVWREDDVSLPKSTTFSNCFCCVDTEESVLSSSETLCFDECSRLFSSSASAAHTPNKLLVYEVGRKARLTVHRTIISKCTCLLACGLLCVLQCCLELWLLRYQNTNSLNVNLWRGKQRNTHLCFIEH